MITPVFPGSIIKGQIKAGVSFHRWLASLEGQFVEIIVRKKGTQRSQSQNKYYFGVVVKMFSYYTGFSQDEAHMALREKFLSVLDERSGLERIRSTTELKTGEFEEYLTQCRQLYHTLTGHTIPLPNEVEY